MQHEPSRQRLGQLRNGKLLLSLKSERVHRSRYRTRDEARADIFDYIERFYNPRRRHSTLNYVSPATYEESKMAQKL